MKVASSFAFTPRTPTAKKPSGNPHDGGTISTGRFIVLADVPEPRRLAAYDQIIAFARSTPPGPLHTQALRVEHAATVAQAADFLGTPLAEKGPDEHCPIYAHAGAFVWADEGSAARLGADISGAKSPWPPGGRHSLGMVLARIVTGDPANRWSSWTVVNVAVGPHGTTILAWTSPACEKAPSGAASTGIVAVVDLPSARFPTESRQTATLVCTPWATTRIRQAVRESAR